jgi:hypothetical protein
MIKNRDNINNMMINLNKKVVEKQTILKITLKNKLINNNNKLTNDKREK